MIFAISNTTSETESSSAAEISAADISKTVQLTKTF